MKKRIYEFLFFKLMGWKITGVFEASLKKCVIIVVPHTSWHDFYIGLLTRGIIGLEMNFVGKKELFLFPFGYYFKSIGGAPLDRSGGQNKVDAIAALFEQRDVFRLAIAPEGTRKKVNSWRTGYYYIALKAKVPILPVAFDFSKKEVRIGTPYFPTGDLETDTRILESFFKDAVGKFPDKSFTPQH